MKKVLLPIFVLFVLASSLVAQQNSAAKQKPLVFTHVAVIDVTGGPAQPDRTVVILGRHIAEIGDSAKIVVPQDSQVVEAKGKFLIPGLWDMHVHWFDKDYLPLFIANGVTGVRQMFGTPELLQQRNAIEKGNLLGPRMIIASPLVDGPKPLWPGSISVATEAEGRLAVTQVKQDGADFVKVYSFLPREAYFAIADEAKKQAIPFAGHVPFGVSVDEASDAGQKSIEHLAGMFESCSSRAEELHKMAQEDLADMIAMGKPDLTGGSRYHAAGHLLLDSYSAEKCATVFAHLKKNATWICPTLVLFRTMALVDDSSLLKDPRAKYMPRQVRESWDPKTNFLLKMGAGNVDYVKEQYRRDLEMVAGLGHAGVGIIAGTDMLIPYGLPGFGLHDELALYVQAGLTPLAALQTATYNAARFLGKEKEMGTVEKGKIADLVLLDANPLEDIKNTTRIAAVVYDGKLFPKSSIVAMLAHAEVLASRKSVAETLSKTINEKDIESAIKQYHELRATQPDKYDFGEDELNSLGYQLLGSKQIKAAIQVFQLNVEVYPESFNTYDSLGEAYLANGDKELASKNYKKSLELNPKNTNAVEMLKKLVAQ
jgi:imidazolonepropionase-like amidohydrolase